jgi:drug/metabolite transporter (DMT)-like permease
MPLAINRKWSIVLGTLLVFPTAYFILISLLNELGYPYLSEYAQPLLEQMGIKESPGLNINSLILFGPFIALLLNLFAVLRIDWYNLKEQFSVKISIQKHWWNMVLVIVSGILLAALFIYALGENCRC